MSAERVRFPVWTTLAAPARRPGRGMEAGLSSGLQILTDRALRGTACNLWNRRQVPGKVYLQPSRHTTLALASLTRSGCRWSFPATLAGGTDASLPLPYASHKPPFNQLEQVR